MAFAKLRRGNEDMYLQITSLIDTLVIILVFMLMTVGTETVNLEMAQGIVLPFSKQGGTLTEGLKLVAKTDGIYLDSEQLVPLTNALVPAEWTSEGGKKIVPVFNKLVKIAVQTRREAEKNKVKFEGRILFQADKSIPLKTIKQIVYSSARAGFNDFKFAVVRQ